VEQAQKAGIKVCIMTATMIKEDPNNSLNKTLAPYNGFLRELAARKKCLLADTNAAMQKELAALKKMYPKAKGNLLTADGVHMAPAGDMMMARCLLKTVGVPDANIDFNKLPCNAEITLKVPMGFYQDLYNTTLQKGKGVKDVAAFLDLRIKK
jgi:hypothetical protein